MRFRKKPVEVEAVQHTGDNEKELRAFLAGSPFLLRDSYPVILEIPTLEGTMTARVGDWIIRGVQGEFYPCKPDIFEATYEPVEPAPADRGKP